MRRVGALLAVAFAAWPAAAAAQPVEFAHGTIDNQLTTTRPNTPTGFSFNGVYHAAGDPSGDPPYMRRMTFYPDRGLRYDTSVPEKCTASDVELQARGAAACPEGSRLGGGTAVGKFMDSESELTVDMFNNTGEIIMVTASPLLATVGRGKFGPDGSIEWNTPTCFPATNPCPVDNALQVRSSISMKPYVRGARSYLTTPPACPKSGHWEQPVRLWWADGTDDTAVTQQPCDRPAKTRKKRKKRRH